MRLLHALVCATLVPFSCAEEPKPATATAEQESEESEEDLHKMAVAAEKAMQDEDNGENDEEGVAQAATAGKEGGLVEEWDKHMEGFVPELLLTFPLPSRTDEFFYEDVEQPVLVRGGFFATSSDEESSVDFQITSPKGDVVFERHGEPEGLFHFIAQEKGTYAFVVSNHKWMEQKMVTFALGKGNNTHLTNDHLEGLDLNVRSIDRTLRDVQTESTYLWIRQKSHMKAVEGIHSRVFWFCVLEFLVLVAISGFQVYYIKGMLSDRRLL